MVTLLAPRSPLLVGVPTIWLPWMDRPAGRPETASQVPVTGSPDGGPVAVRVVLYADIRVAVGSELVVITGAASLILMLNVFFAVRPVLVWVKANSTKLSPRAPVGVPVIWPVVVF